MPQDRAREADGDVFQGFQCIEMPALRLLTCGSVDDGKSTLIGRLLYEQGLIPEDQLATLECDSRARGGDGALDFSLLLDGLEAERDQGITIDVAYRYFSTKRRSFIVADTPGHEQYTRNMATGASNSDLTLILVDARKGLLAQTFRHAVIASLLGVRQAVLVVNKMDLVQYDQAPFAAIAREFERFASKLRFESVSAVPISAREGENVSSKSARMSWDSGPHLLELLEHADAESVVRDSALRMIVQWVNRPHADFRGYSGSLVGGSVRRGDEIVVSASGAIGRVARIVTADGDLGAAQAGDAVTLALSEDIDISRGDVLAEPGDRPQVADQFAAHLVWMSEEPMLPGRSYLLKIGARTVPASVTELKYRLDPAALDHHAAKTLAMNEIGMCNLALGAQVSFDSFEKNRATGAFILIDRLSNATAAAGMIDFALRRATNIHYQDLSVTKSARAQLKRQRPAILWFTGLPSAGKSTIANLVESQLYARSAHTILLDGDNIRHGLNRDLGFTDADRVENIRRIAEVAKLMAEAGLIVLCSFISPFRAERRMARELAECDFIEIFVDTPIEKCIARDPKGLYQRALAGKIKNFTGIDQPYERPERADIRLDAENDSPEASADRIIAELFARKIMW